MSSLIEQAAERLAKIRAAGIELPGENDAGSLLKVAQDFEGMRALRLSFEREFHVSGKLIDGPRVSDGELSQVMEEGVERGRLRCELPFHAFEHPAIDGSGGILQSGRYRVAIGVGQPGNGVSGHPVRAGDFFGARLIGFGERHSNGCAE